MPTASVAEAVSVTAVPTVAVSGESVPTDGAVVSAELAASDTVMVVVAPVPILPEVSLHVPYMLKVPDEVGA